MAARDTEETDVDFFLQALLDDHGKTKRYVSHIGPKGNASGRRVLVLMATVDGPGVHLELLDGTEFLVIVKRTT